MPPLHAANMLQKNSGIHSMGASTTNQSASWRTANERHSRPSSQEEEGRPAPAGGAGEHNGNTSPAGSSASTAGNFTWERPRHVDESAAGRVLESGVANHMFVPSGNIKGLRIKRGSTDSSSDDSWGSNEDAGDFLQEADTMSDVEEQVPEAEKKREELNTFTETNSLWSQLRMLKVVFDRAELSEEQQTRFLQTLKPVDYQPGEYIVREGDKFFIITRGKVSVFRNKSPEKLVHLYQGHFFGEFSLLREEPRNANVRAVDEVRCLYVAKDVFKPFVESDNKFKQLIAELMLR